MCSLRTMFQSGVPAEMEMTLRDLTWTRTDSDIAYQCLSSDCWCLDVATRTENGIHGINETQLEDVFPRNPSFAPRFLALNMPNYMTII
jgi:hypothetical protein